MDRIKALEVNVDDLNNGGVFALIKDILEHKPEDVELSVASIEGFKDSANCDYFNKLGCKIFNIGVSKNKIVKQVYVYKNLKRLIEQGGFNNVHIHADTANKLLVSGYAAKKAGAKNIILHSHASDVDGKMRYAKRMTHWLCRPFLKLLDAKFLSCSDTAAKWMYGKSQYIKINNGVDIEEFRFNTDKRKKVRSDLKIDTEFLIGHVGRFAYQKNHEYILKIASNLKHSNLNFKILLVGNGPLEEEIKHKVEIMNLSKYFIFYGTSKNVSDLLCAMDIFILPSHFEGLPVVGVEAQATGLPVLYANTITKEAAIIKECAYIGIQDADLGEWVRKIIDFSSLKRRDPHDELKEAGFDIKDVAIKFCSLYR